MATVLFDPSIAWQFGLPPYLPGDAANIGDPVFTEDPSSWILDWAGSENTSGMLLVLLGTNLTGAPGASLPATGTITNFRITTPILNSVFDISGLSLSAADLQEAVTTNTLGEALLGGNDTFVVQTGGAIFADNLRLRGYGGDDKIDLGTLGAFTGYELLGDAGDDSLTGSNLNFTGDSLDGGIGDDILYGMAGGDLLFGGGDEDRQYGGDDADTLSGGTGRDMLFGDGGDDLVVLTVESQPEGEIVDGGAGLDLLSLGGSLAGPESVIDLSGTFVTGFERLELFAATGLMTVAQFQQFDTVELYGPVTLRFADAGFVTLGGAAWFGSVSAGVVRVIGSDFGDIILGRAAADVATSGAPLGTTALDAADLIDGAAGNDRLFGSGGRDTLLGSSGNDTLRGEAGDDRCEGGTGNDLLVGGRGADALLGGAGNGDMASYETANFGLRVRLGPTAANTGDAVGDTFTAIEGLRGSAFDDTLIGDGAANRIEGSSGDDSLLGGLGNDTLMGGSGADRLVAAEGIDVMEGGSDNDQFIFTAFSDSAAATPDIVLDFNSVEDRINLASVIPGAFAYNATNGFVGGGTASLFHQVSGGNTDIFVDMGDGGSAEMVIRLAGTVALTQSNFIL